MNFSIPHSALSAEEKKECMEIMEAGNGLMKAWAEEFFGKTLTSSRLRKGLFKWIADQNDPQAIDPAEVGIPPSVLEVILKVRTIESKLMFGHVRMVVGLARKYSWALNVTYLDLDDLLLEGFIALRDAIYSYDKPTMAGFITYAHLSIRRRFRRKINEAADFGGFNKVGFKLLEKYHATRRKLEQQLETNVQVDTVIMCMGISDDDRRHLYSMLKRCLRASTLSGNDQNEQNAYENLGCTQDVRELDLQVLVQVMNRDGISPAQQGIVLAAVEGKVGYKEASHLVASTKGHREYVERSGLMLEAVRRGQVFWDAVKRAPLSDMERELVVAAAKGEKNFQSRIADNHINPKTQKPYSRMMATNMLRRAYLLVLEELRHRESVAA